MAVRTYGTTWQFYDGKEFREASTYVSDGASDRFGGGGAGTTFKGNGGNDVILARGGDDVLFGGSGNDTLCGGTGADGFVFNTGLGSRNVDRIADFSRSQRDKIVLDNNVFVGLKPVPVDPFKYIHLNELRGLGDLQKTAFRVGKEAQDGDDRVIYDKETGGMYFDRDGTGPAAQIKFAQLKAGTTVYASDILVF